MYEVMLKHGTALVNSTKQSGRRATFDSLEAGTPYTVSVVAISGEQRGKAVKKDCHTSKYFVTQMCMNIACTGLTHLSFEKAVIFIWDMTICFLSSNFYPSHYAI